MLPTDLTVSAIVEKDGRFLIVEERSSGIVVVNQPGGHIEIGESPEDAIVRETLEEAGCEISVTGFHGVYLWIQPQTRQQFLSIVYTADLVSENTQRALDDGVYAVHWYSPADLRNRRRELRSPIVLRCVEDHIAGRRLPAELIESMQPIHKNVDSVLANALLV